MVLAILGLFGLVVVVVILALAASRPDTFRIERSSVVNAPPEKLFPLIDDFNRWGAWSPWEKLDPNLKRTYSGAAKGKGAVYEWEGNREAGQGRMEIVESTPSSRVLIKLDFFKPFEAHNQADFTLNPDGSSTRVVWAMTGPHPFPMKVMSVFMSMDSLVGKDFEKGLAAMKAIAES
jgi:hypothetical protein